MGNVASLRRATSRALLEHNNPPTRNRVKSRHLRDLKKEFSTAAARSTARSVDNRVIVRRVGDEASRAPISLARAATAR